MLDLGAADALAPFLARLAARLTALLEGGEHHQQVAPAVDLLSALGAAHPPLLRPHFADFVDLVVGWSLDADVPPRVRERFTRALGALPQLWAQDPKFAQALALAPCPCVCPCVCPCPCPCPRPCGPRGCV